MNEKTSAKLKTGIEVNDNNLFPRSRGSHWAWSIPVNAYRTFRKCKLGMRMRLHPTPGAPNGKSRGELESIKQPVNKVMHFKCTMCDTRSLLSWFSKFPRSFSNRSSRRNYVDFVPGISKISIVAWDVKEHISRRFSLWSATVLWTTFENLIYNVYLHIYFLNYFVFRRENGGKSIATFSTSASVDVRKTCLEKWSSMDYKDRREGKYTSYTAGWNFTKALSSPKCRASPSIMIKGICYFAGRYTY